MYVVLGIRSQCFGAIAAAHERKLAWELSSGGLRSLESLREHTRRVGTSGSEFLSDQQVRKRNPSFAFGSFNKITSNTSVGGNLTVDTHICKLPDTPAVRFAYFSLFRSSWEVRVVKRHLIPSHFTILVYSFFFTCATADLIWPWPLQGCRVLDMSVPFHVRPRG